jgi:glyoxylase I family protein
MADRLVFSHVALNCQDPAAMERFYTKHLGFERARVIPLGDDQIVFLRSGGMRLELFRASDNGPRPRPEKDGPVSPGIRHLAFQVDDVDRVLSAMGEEARVTLGPLTFDDFIPGWKTVWVSDPDGNVVEISQGYVDQDHPPQG